MDQIVFIPPWESVASFARANYPAIFNHIENDALFEALLLDYVHEPGKTIRITDGQGHELQNNQEIAAADRVLILCLDKNNKDNSFYLPVSSNPKVGYRTYDTTKQPTEDGQAFRTKHLGNKVMSIEEV